MEDAKKGQKAVVRWAAANFFEERTMRPVDWARVGGGQLKEGEAQPGDTVWNQYNDWSVPRSQIPLSDQQLAAFVARDGKFSISEG